MLSVINPEKYSWCKQCKYTGYYDWYLCSNENIDDTKLDGGIWIPTENFWRTCPYYEKEEGNQNE